MKTLLRFIALASLFTVWWINILFHCRGVADDSDMDALSNEAPHDETNQAAVTSSDLDTPFWWIEEEEDDWFGRKYVSDKELYYAVRDLPTKVKGFFNPMCGHYRFNETGLPDVSVIVTTQNELSGWTTVAVHSILARTPPHLLKEVIVVDDNGVPLEVRGTNVNETEFKKLRKLPKVKVIQNHDREGCARSRLVGAKAAKGQVLMFVDSHIEMLHSTWYQHLLIPIVENPRTVSMQSLEAIDDKGGKDYIAAGGGNALGAFSRGFSFNWQDYRFKKAREAPGHREPYEIAIGPGSLFAIRRDEFWRLGGYDEGLYVWGGENIELSLKSWMCGGRLVCCPCSRVGHMFRVSEELKAKQWPPQVPSRVADKLNLGLKDVPGTGQEWPHMDNFTKVCKRNDIRVMNIWMGEHPAKYAYYKETLGSEKLGPEWQQYVDELKTDPAALKQIRKRKENKCHDFEWWDRHVYMKLTGKHHPWFETPNSVSCGGHRAKSCEECPSGNGKDWCNGDCKWCGPTNKCLLNGTQHHNMCSALKDQKR